MPKPTRTHRNRKPSIKAGDRYTVSNDVEIADVDGDGAVDLRLTHMTKRNGEAFFESQMVWYGIDPVIGEAFAATYQPVLGNDLPIRNFGQLVKHWKLLAKGTEKVTDAGKLLAEGIGEAAD
jgi:hypothetical protein